MIKLRTSEVRRKIHYSTFEKDYGKIDDYLDSLTIVCCPKEDIRFDRKYYLRSGHMYTGDKAIVDGQTLYAIIAGTRTVFKHLIVLKEEVFKKYFIILEEK